MAKSTHAPILAAGGIVIRNGAKPLFAVVQRRRDDAWVLPKGKLKPNERPIAAARREAREETGSDVRVHEFLGAISYRSGNGPKIAHFWRMQAIGGSAGRLMGDIRAVEWLSLTDALDRLSLSREHLFLRNVGRKALRRMRRKARGKVVVEKPATEIIVPAAAAAVPAMKAAAPPLQADLPAMKKTPPAMKAALPPVLETATAAGTTDAALVRLKPAKPQPRWGTLARFAKRWHGAMGRRRRAG
jgi:8-oxo-dGTP diphosphatase